MDQLSPAERNPLAMAWGYLFTVYGMLAISLGYIGLIYPEWAFVVIAVGVLAGNRLARWFNDKMRKIEE